MANQTHGQVIRENLGEAGQHVRGAASAAGKSVRGAAVAAGEQIAEGAGRAREELGEAGRAGRDAAREARLAADEQWHAAMDRGRGLLENAESMVRERPLAAFGIALGAGFLLGRLLRH